MVPEADICPTRWQHLFVFHNDADVPFKKLTQSLIQSSVYSSVIISCHSVHCLSLWLWIHPNSDCFILLLSALSVIFHHSAHSSSWLNSLIHCHSLSMTFTSHLKLDGSTNAFQHEISYKCFAALFMVALCNRAEHYIFILFLLSSSSFFFFPRLISAVGDWMFTILWHMVWS